LHFFDPTPLVPFSATYNLCSKKINNKKVGSPFVSQSYFNLFIFLGAQDDGWKKPE
jgi:hypothetical protein